MRGLTQLESDTLGRCRSSVSHPQLPGGTQREEHWGNYETTFWTVEMDGVQVLGQGERVRRGWWQK